MDCGPRPRTRVADAIRAIWRRLGFALPLISACDRNDQILHQHVCCCNYGTVTTLIPKMVEFRKMIDVGNMFAVDALSEGMPK